MRYSRFSFIIIVLVITFGVIAGCSTLEPSDDQFPTMTLDKLFPVEESPGVIDAKGGLPTPTLTFTKSSTPMTIIMSTTTATPIPTLHPAEGRALVLDLLKSNRGCYLPCWWGITPNQTAWTEAKIFFMNFDNNIWRNREYAEVLIPSVAGLYGDFNQIGIRLMIQNDRVKTLEISGLRDSPYSIQNMMKTYGKPEQIWIKTFKRLPDNRIPFTLLLFYPELGITAGYSDLVKKEFDSSVIRGCLQSGPVLHLWFPETHITLKEFGDLFELSIDDAEPYLSLAEATGMDVATFYETFENYQEAICLETPDAIWPDPFVH